MRRNNSKKIHVKCLRCKFKIKIKKLRDFTTAKKMGIIKRVNYPFGKRGKARILLYCTCLREFGFNKDILMVNVND